LEVPLVSLDYLDTAGGLVPWRAPIEIRDRQLQLAEYGPSGDIHMTLRDATVFPTDVLVVRSADSDTVLVFLRRSPHGGCLLSYDLEVRLIHDPCLGSKFDLSGEVLSGPSSRGLDRLPTSIRDGLVWVSDEVEYSASKP
jgi:Rieske Fe-S protein